MTELLTAAQMRAIEVAAIESGEVTGLELMERAGRGVVEAVFEEWPELRETSHRAVVLCGPGNNGGDGFVVARLLKELGWDVEVFLYGDPEKLPLDAKVNYERWGKIAEVQILQFPDFSQDRAIAISERIECTGKELIVDALFGTGLARPVSQGVHSLFQWVEMASTSALQKGLCRRVAIDIPSGHCADSGLRLDANRERSMGYNAFDADLTVSFHSLKVGHELEECPKYCGRIVVKSIGLEDNPRPRLGEKPSLGGAVGSCPAVPLGETVKLVDENCVANLQKHQDSHKYTHGHALILSGGSGKTGAARLAAKGALRIGAGLVTLGVPPSAQMEVASQITALMLKRIADADALANALRDLRFNALCLGPGLGLERATQLVPVALQNTSRAVVLDADALSAFQDNPEALFAQLHQNCVLTPHEGEFKRLFPDLHTKLCKTPTKGPAYSKVDATREAAARAGCSILFKGPDTVIADQTGRCSINSAHFDRAAPWLATAGSGDVLAGFITGLLARGFAAMQAAEAASWLHVEAARHFGPGLIAEDIPEQLPAVFHSLGV